MSSVPVRPGTRATHVGLVAGLAVVALVAFWLLHENPRLLGDLLVLAGIAVVVFFAARAVWRAWWKRRNAVLSRIGLGIAFGAGCAGWAAVALVAWLKRIPSDNYIWIIVAPLMMLVVFGAGLICLAGAGLGVSVAVWAPPGGRRGQLIGGGIVSALLCLSPAYFMVRLLGP